MRPVAGDGEWEGRAEMATGVSDSIVISREEARWLVVAAQGLDRRPHRRRATKADLLATIQRLGCVQLDSISVVSRSHETVLWSRLGSFNTALIAELYDPDAAVAEFLAHAAAIVPVGLLPLFRPYMERARQREGWATDPANRAVMDHVLDRIRRDGPLGSRHFESPEEAGPAAPWAWYGTKPERRALDLLWLRGDLVVRRRDGFQRVFDLAERVVPALWGNEAISEVDCRRELTRRALGALGVATASWTADYFRTGGPSHLPVRTAASELRALAAEGAALQAVVEGIAGPCWLDPALLPLLDELRAGRGRPVLTTLLSPFDSLVWDRDRALTLFGFDYRLESYTPAVKRRYGYYTLPILDRGRIVGRLDPAYDRWTKVLTAKALHLEPWVRPSARLATAIDRAARDLVAFLGGDGGEPSAIRWLHADPATMLPLLERAGRQ